MQSEQENVPAMQMQLKTGPVVLPTSFPLLKLFCEEIQELALLVSQVSVLIGLLKGPETYMCINLYENIYCHL